MAAHQAPPSLGFSRQEHWSGLPFPFQCMKVKSESEVAQLCPTLCDPMDCSLPGSSIHGSFQARVLEGVAIAFSWDSSATLNWQLTVWQLESTSYSPDASNPICFRQSSCEVSSRGYYRLNVCISPKLVCWNSVPQCDGIRRWGLWELIRVRWGHEGGAPMNGISALLRVTRELASLCSAPSEDTRSQ